LVGERATAAADRIRDLARAKSSHRFDEAAYSLDTLAPTNSTRHIALFYSSMKTPSEVTDYE